MRNLFVILSFVLVISLLFGCSAGRYHKQELPDPQSFNAHFGEMDLDGNDLVNWTEFKDRFPQAEEKVFAAFDLNGDGYIDHEEWQKFMEAHGMKHG